LTEFTNVTDGRKTDGQTDGQTGRHEGASICKWGFGKGEKRKSKLKDLVLRHEQTNKRANNLQTWWKYS